MSKKLHFEPLQRIAFHGVDLPKFLTRNPLFFERVVSIRRRGPEPAIRVLSLSPWYNLSRLSEEREVQGCSMDDIRVSGGWKAKSRLTLFYKDFSRFLVPCNTYHSGLSKFYSDHGLMPELTEIWTLPETCGEIPW